MQQKCKLLNCWSLNRFFGNWAFKDTKCAPKLFKWFATGKEREPHSCGRGWCLVFQAEWGAGKGWGQPGSNACPSVRPQLWAKAPPGQVKAKSHC